MLTGLDGHPLRPPPLVWMAPGYGVLEEEIERTKQRRLDGWAPGGKRKHGRWRPKGLAHKRIRDPRLDPLLDYWLTPVLQSSVATTPTNGTTFTLSDPGTAGWFGVVFFTDDTTNNVGTGPSGWVSQFNATLTAVDGQNFQLWTKNSLTGSGTYTWPSVDVVDCVVIFNAYSGFDTTTPINASGSQTDDSAQASPYTVTAPTITTTADAILCWFGGIDPNGTVVADTWAAPSSYTLRTSQRNLFSSIAYADRNLVTPGATGAAAGTDTMSGGLNAARYGIHLAIGSPAASLSSTVLFDEAPTRRRIFVPRNFRRANEWDPASREVAPSPGPLPDFEQRPTPIRPALRRARENELVLPPEVVAGRGPVDEPDVPNSPKRRRRWLEEFVSSAAAAAAASGVADDGDGRRRRVAPPYRDLPDDMPLPAETAPLPAPIPDVEGRQRRVPAIRLGLLDDPFFPPEVAPSPGPIEDMEPRQRRVPPVKRGPLDEPYLSAEVAPAPGPISDLEPRRRWAPPVRRGQADDPFLAPEIAPAPGPIDDPIPRPPMLRSPTRRPPEVEVPPPQEVAPQPAPVPDVEGRPRKTVPVRRGQQDEPFLVAETAPSPGPGEDEPGRRQPPRAPVRRATDADGVPLAETVTTAAPLPDAEPPRFPPRHRTRPDTDVPGSSITTVPLSPMLEEVDPRHRGQRPAGRRPNDAEGVPLAEVATGATPIEDQNPRVPPPRAPMRRQPEPDGPPPPEVAPAPGPLPDAEPSPPRRRRRGQSDDAPLTAPPALPAALAEDAPRAPRRRRAPAAAEEAPAAAASTPPVLDEAPRRPPLARRPRIEDRAEQAFALLAIEADAVFRHPRQRRPPAPEGDVSATISIPPPPLLVALEFDPGAHRRLRVRLVTAEDPLFLRLLAAANLLLQRRVAAVTGVTRRTAGATSTTLTGSGSTSRRKA